MLKKQKRYNLRLRLTATALAAVLSLSACTFQEMDRMSRKAQASGDIARGHVNEQMRTSQGALVWTDKPWVNLKPVPTVAHDGQKAPFPDCQITLGRDGLTLPEIGERITALCGVRVLFSPDALATGQSGGTTRALNGPLPAPDDNGRLPLDQLGGGETTRVASAPQVLNGLRWQGKLSGLLDMIAARTGLTPRMDNGAILFSLMETRAFQFTFLNTNITSNASVTSGSTSSMGTSGGSTTSSSVSGDSSSSQQTTVDQSRNVYDDMKKTLETMLTPQKGRFWLSASTGTLTVTDTPSVLNSIAAYVEQQNRQMNRQVRLNVQVLSVSTSRKEQLGLDWNIVYKSLRSAGASLNNVSGDITNATSASVSVLDTATGNAAKFAGSSLLIKALSEQGDVSVVTSQGSVTTNLTPVPIQMADQTVYVAGSATTTTTDVGATTTLTPGMMTTGFNMTLLPLIKDDGDVQLQVAFNLSDPPTIRSFTSKDGNSYIEMPYTKLRSLSQKTNLRAGQSLVLTGFDQSNTRMTKDGTFTPGNFLLGGGRNGDDSRSTLVIIITPELMGNGG
ncbi:PilN family type IVB pilus formation outer membrane protein [Salmonella enterica]|nr:PilN family type IVB pilus formation outer membrane protein [Salmonella enterica]